MTVHVQAFRRHDGTYVTRVTRDSGRKEPDLLRADGTWWNVLDDQPDFGGTVYPIPQDALHPLDTTWSYLCSECSDDKLARMVRP